MKGTLSNVPIAKELDIVGARQTGRNIANDLGFSSVDQARIATAISELARNIYLYSQKRRNHFPTSRRRSTSWAENYRKR